MPSYVYILASKKYGTFYVGMTNDIARRVYEHREGFAEGFTKTHGVKTLVYIEEHERAEDAIRREKRLKRWNRNWKDEPIERDIPDWDDLFERL